MNSTEDALTAAAIENCVAALPAQDRDSIEAYVLQFRRLLTEGGRLAYVALAVVGAAAAAEPKDLAVK